MKEFEYQYITKAERMQYNIGINSSTVFNRGLPHYTLAYALFNRQ
jgi:hypothetical protein